MFQQIKRAKNIKFQPQFFLCLNRKIVIGAFQMLSWNNTKKLLFFSCIWLCLSRPCLTVSVKCFLSVWEDGFPLHEKKLSFPLIYYLWTIIHLRLIGQLVSLDILVVVLEGFCYAIMNSQNGDSQIRDHRMKLDWSITFFDRSNDAVQIKKELGMPIQEDDDGSFEMHPQEP